MEYNYLLTSQLETQRKFYEEQLAASGCSSQELDEARRAATEALADSRLLQERVRPLTHC